MACLKHRQSVTPSRPFGIVLSLRLRIKSTPPGHHLPLTPHPSPRPTPPLHLQHYTHQKKKTCWILTHRTTPWIKIAPASAPMVYGWTSSPRLAGQVLGHILLPHQLLPPPFNHSSGSAYCCTCFPAFSSITPDRLCWMLFVWKTTSPLKVEQSLLDTRRKPASDIIGTSRALTRPHHRICSSIPTSPSLIFIILQHYSAEDDFSLRRLGHAAQRGQGIDKHHRKCSNQRARPGPPWLLRKGWTAHLWRPSGP